MSQGMQCVDMNREGRITEQIYYRWRKQFDGVGPPSRMNVNGCRVGAGLANGPGDRLSGGTTNGS